MTLICIWECSLQTENEDGIGSKAKGWKRQGRHKTSFGSDRLHSTFFASKVGINQDAPRNSSYSPTAEMTEGEIWTSGGLSCDKCLALPLL